MEVKANRLDRGFLMHKEKYEKKALEVLNSGWYVLGNEVASFETEFSQYIGCNYCVGLASGLDALVMAFRILNIGEGDEVLVQGNTYIASVMGITINGAKPVFVEPDEFHNIDPEKLEEKITNKTKAILAVHLYGQTSRMKRIVEIAKKHDLKVVEDCAQSHGSMCEGEKSGTFGDIGCFSFYPSKNLGGFGDGGAIVTNSEEIMRKAKILRNYGSEKRYYNCVVGMNSRLDEMQAGLLRIKLQYLEELTEERKDICRRYLQNLDNKYILLPEIAEGVTTVWHQFVIRCAEREELIEYLNRNQIGTIIHYPIPPHLSEAYSYLNIKEGSLPITEKYAKEVLSIPLYNGMTIEEQEYVIRTINQFEVG